MQSDGADDASGEGGATADAELGVGMREVGTNRVQADSETTADRPVVESLGLQHGDLQLTCRQQFRKCLLTSLHAPIMRRAPPAPALAKSYSFATRAAPSERV